MAYFNRDKWQKKTKKEYRLILCSYCKANAEAEKQKEYTMPCPRGVLPDRTESEQAAYDKKEKRALEHGGAGVHNEGIVENRQETEEKSREDISGDDGKKEKEEGGNERGKKNRE